MEYYLAMIKNEIWPFVAAWMELEGIMLNEISQSEKDIICFHSYVELERLNRNHRGKEGEKYSYKQRGRTINSENKLRIDGWGAGERGKRVMSIEEGTFWDEHWVLYLSDESWESTPQTKSTLYVLSVSQLDHKLYLKNNKANKGGVP